MLYFRVGVPLFILCADKDSVAQRKDIHMLYAEMMAYPRNRLFHTENLSAVSKEYPPGFQSHVNHSLYIVLRPAFCLVLLFG